MATTATPGRTEVPFGQKGVSSQDDEQKEGQGRPYGEAARVERVATQRREGRGGGSYKCDRSQRGEISLWESLLQNRGWGGVRRLRGITEMAKKTSFKDISGN